MRRMGPVYVTGELGSVSLDAPGGITTVYLDGVAERVNLNLAGITSVFIGAGSPDLTITGA